MKSTFPTPTVLIRNVGARQSVLKIHSNICLLVRVPEIALVGNNNYFTDSSSINLYFPFLAGQKFALLEIKTVVSKVVRTFEILPPLDELASMDGYSRHFVGLSLAEQKKRLLNPSKYDPVLSAVLTLKSENGIFLRLRERT